MEFSQSLIESICNAEHLLFFTGAGISAESGIHTFRGEGGLWNKFKPEELANMDAFMRNSDLVWEWYQYRRSVVHAAQPNAGHTTIAELENNFRVDVVTQNIDGLHRRAGSTSIYELHGNIDRNYCLSCGKRYDYISFDGSAAPLCEQCGGKIRPDIVWFGEMLPTGIFEQAEQIAREADVCFVVGTSGVVYPAAYIPFAARDYGKIIVEVNPEKTDMTTMSTYSLRGKSGEVLPELFGKVLEMRKR